MLSKKPMSFSEMLGVLGVSSSFLNYHLENLGELVSKTNDSRYKLSSFGEAAIATMTKVEDIPTTTRHQSPETRPKKIGGRSVAAALGIICVILVASLGSVIVAYTFTVNDKNDTISSLRSQISQLNSNVTNLQKQITSDDTTINSLFSNITNLQEELNSVLNRSSYMEDMIMSDPSAWFNKTVIVEGNLSVSYVIATYPPGLLGVPFFAQLSSDGHSIAVWNNDMISQLFNVPKQVFNSSSNMFTVCRYVWIYGVVESWLGAPPAPGESGANLGMYYIYPEAVEPL
jgi:cell division protein FtsL